MTTPTVTFATYAAEVAAQDGTTNEMVIAATSTMVATTAGYFDGGWIVSDQSAALETYTGAATDAEKTAADDYTASTKMNDVCVTGSMTAEESGTDTAIAMMSCARAQAVCSTAGGTDITCTYSY